MLEIGAFEGASTTWMLDHMAGHPESSLVSVDTFEGGIDYKVTEKASYQAHTLEQRYTENVKRCENFSKLTTMKMTSQEALIALRQQDQKFDFIYIDGSHVALDVLSDAIMAWPMLTLGGVMVFDDLHWQEYKHEAYNPGVAILGFLRCVAPEAHAQEAAGQMWVQRVERYIPAQRRRPEA